MASQEIDTLKASIGSTFSHGGGSFNFEKLASSTSTQGMVESSVELLENGLCVYPLEVFIAVVWALPLIQAPLLWHVALCGVRFCC